MAIADLICLHDLFSLQQLDDDENMYCKIVFTFIQSQSRGSLMEKLQSKL